MLYPVVLSLACLCYFLYRRRVLLTIRLSTAKSLEGDYDAALRRLRWVNFGLSKAGKLHHEALILMLADRANEAEPLLRKALEQVETRYPRERLYSSLGHALTTLGRFEEAEEWLNQAVRAGDATGNSYNGLCELCLAQGRTAEALAFAERSIEAARARGTGRVPPVYYQDHAHALALRGRAEEARESLAAAGRQKVPETASGRGCFQWNMGAVLLVLLDNEKAYEHFRLGAIADPNGKYGHRCAEALRRAGLKTPTPAKSGAQVPVRTEA